MAPLLRRELDLLLQDILVDFLDVFAVKRSLSRQQLVSDDAEAPYVNLFRILLVLHKLWRHIQRRTKHEVEAGLRAELAREAKIRNLHVEVHRVLTDEQNILGLNVTVCYRLQVHIVEAQHYLMADVRGLRLGKDGQFCEPLEELAALHQLRHYVIVYVILD